MPARAATPGGNGLISFVRYKEREVLWTIRPDGSRPRKIGRVTIARSHDCPAWSPDGRRFAYIGPSAGSNWGLWVMRRDGTHRHEVYDSNLSEASPDWSPNGRRLVFASIENPDLEIFTIKVDGTGRKKVTRNSNWDDSGASWSPDGTRIAFFRIDRNSEKDTRIYTIHPDGTGLKKLTGSKGRGQEFSPDWSPDGRRVVFERHTRDKSDIFTIARNGERLKNLTRDKHVEYYPSWSPNGKRIVYGSTKGKGGIFTKRRDGSGDRRLTRSDDDICPDWQPKTSDS